MQLEARKYLHDVDQAAARLSGGQGKSGPFEAIFLSSRPPLAAADTPQSTHDEKGPGVASRASFIER